MRARRRQREELRRARADEALTDAFAARIGTLYPACPPPRARAIATHAAACGSGRVGRSAAGRALEDHAIELAVVAAVRHEDTRYDELLMAGVARAEARDLVRSDVERIVSGWRRATSCRP